MRNDDTSSYFFETSDLPLATTLTALGFPLQELDASDPIRVIFKFFQDENLKNTVSAFWQNELRVEPKTFSNAQRELKARIRSQIYGSR